MNYEKWITLQSAKISRAICQAAKAGICDGLAIYVLPANGDEWGCLELAAQPLYGSCRVLAFPGVGNAVGFVPTPHLRGLLHHACRDLPICGA